MAHPDGAHPPLGSLHNGGAYIKMSSFQPRGRDVITMFGTALVSHSPGSFLSVDEGGCFQHNYEQSGSSASSHDRGKKAEHDCARAHTITGISPGCW